MRARQAAAELDVLHRLQVGHDTGHIGELQPHALNDLVRRRLALTYGLQLDEHATGVEPRTRTAADRAADGEHVGVLLDDAQRRGLALLHALEGDVLVGLAEARQHAGVFLREEALRHRHEKIAGDRDQRDVEDHDG